MANRVIALVPVVLEDLPVQEIVQELKYARDVILIDVGDIDGIQVVAGKRRQVLTHMIPHAKDLGITAMRAAFVLTACAGAGVFGKILFGYIADFVDTRAALFVSMGFQVSGTLLLLIAESYPMLLVVGGVFGLGMGGVVPLWGSLIGEYFGRDSFGRVMGLMGPCMLPIQVSGVPFAGLVYDLTGGYALAYQTYLAAYALAGVSLLMLPRTVPGRSDLSLHVSELEIQR